MARIDLIVDSSGAEQGFRRAENAAERYSRAVRDIPNQNDRASRSSSNLSGSFSRLTGSLFSLQGLIATVSFGAIVRGMTQAVTATERLEASMFSATGTMEEAAAGMDFVHREANRLALDMDVAAEGFIKLAAAAEGTILEGQAVEEVFTGVSTAASALQLSSSDLSGVLLALNQMISKGTVQSQELKLQLGERLPGAFSIAADAMGVTTAELSKMLEKGELATEKFLPKFAALLEQRFSEGAANAADGLGASMARLSNTWTEFVRELSNANSGVMIETVRGFRLLLEVVSEVDSSGNDSVNSFSNSIKAGFGNAAEIIRDLSDVFSDSETRTRELSEEMQTFSFVLGVVGTSFSIVAGNAKALLQTLSLLFSTVAGGVKGWVLIFQGEFSKAFDNLVSTAENIRSEIGNIGKSLTENVIGELQEFAQTWDKIWSDAQKLPQEFNESLANALNFDSFSHGILNLSDVIEETGRSNTESVSELNDAYQKLEDKLFSLGGDFGTFVTHISEVNKEFDKGNISTKEHRILIDRLVASYEVLQEVSGKVTVNLEKLNQNIPESKKSIAELEKELRDVETQSEDSGRAMEDALIRVPDIAEESARGLQRAFSATFRDIFDEGIDGFSGFFDRVKDLFSNLLAELAAAFAASALIRQLGGEGGINIGGFSLPGGSGGFNIPGLGGFGQSINSFGSSIGFAPGADFVGPVQPGFTNATLGGTLGAAGLGFAGGSLFNSLIGGNSTFGGIGGGLGAAAGNILLPGAGGFIGGALGSVLGGLFGNQTPPNQTSAAGLNFGTGEVNVQVLDPETQGKLNKILDPLQELAVSFRDAGFGLREGVKAIVPDVGVRDDIQLGDGVTVKTPEEAIQVIVDRIFDQEWFLDMPPAVEELIKNFEGTSAELVDFTKTVLTLNQQLPQLQAVFGNQSLEAFTGAAGIFGGAGPFGNAVSQFAQRFGFEDEILGATIESTRTQVKGIFDELGTSAETFGKDFKAAIQGTLTPEEIAKWVEGGLALGKLTDQEEALRKVREEGTSQAQALLEAERQAAQEERRRQKDNEFFVRQLQVDAMEDPLEQRLAQRQLDFDERWNNIYNQFKDRNLDMFLFFELQEEAQKKFVKEQEKIAASAQQTSEDMARAAAAFDQAGRLIQDATGRRFFSASAGQLIASEQSRQRAIQSIFESVTPMMSPEEQARQLLTSQQSQFTDLLSSRNAQKLLSRDGALEAFASGQGSERMQSIAKSILEAQTGLERIGKTLSQLEAGEIAGELVLLREEQRKQVEQLVLLGATEAELMQLEALHAEQRRRILEETKDVVEEEEQVNDRLIEQRRRFNEKVEAELLGFANESVGRFADLLLRQQDRMRQAEELGGDTGRLRELQRLQASQLIDQVAQQRADEILRENQVAIEEERRAVIDSNREILDSLNEQLRDTRNNLVGLERIVESVGSAIDSLRGQSEDLTQIDRANARSFLQNIANSGILPESDDRRFRRSLSSLSRIDPNQFSDEVSFRREFFKSLRLLEDVRGIAESQLSFEDHQIQLLETRVDQAETQHEQTMDKFDQSMAMQEEEFAKQRQIFISQLEAMIGIGEGLEFLKEDLANVLSGGETNTKQDSVDMSNVVSFNANPSDFVIPGFADGGTHRGGLRVVGERGPELEFTGSSNILSNGGLKDMVRSQQQMAVEIQRLRQEMRETQVAIVRNTNTTQRKLTRWDLDGIPEERTTA